MEAQKKHKIKMGKISYKVPRDKSPSFLPFLTPSNAVQREADGSVPSKYEYMKRRLFDLNGNPVVFVEKPRKKIPLFES